MHYCTSSTVANIIRHTFLVTHNSLVRVVFLLPHIKKIRQA